MTQPKKKLNLKPETPEHKIIFNKIDPNQKDKKFKTILTRTKINLICPIDKSS